VHDKFYLFEHRCQYKRSRVPFVYAVGLLETNHQYETELAPHIILSASLLLRVNDIIGATAVYIDVAV
jgi:hypothetical protein